MGSVLRRSGWLLVMGFLLGTANAGAKMLAPEGSGMCSVSGGATAGLPTAVCVFPTCPGGSDCLAPTIDKANARIDYFEPLLQWKDRCPNGAFNSCWEVYEDFRLSLGATDPSGVAFVGVNITTEVAGVKQSKKYWAKAETLSADNRYELNGGVVVHVPAGQRLAISVLELCARDTLNNETCITPGNAANLRWVK